MIVTSLFPNPLPLTGGIDIFDVVATSARTFMRFMADQTAVDDVARLDSQMLQDIGLNPDNIGAIAGPEGLREITDRQMW